LFGAIEKRWEERFGKQEVDQLREALTTLLKQFEVKLPDCLPILGYGLYSKGPERERRAPAGRENEADSGPTLAPLLSQALLAFAIEFERESDLSLAISANLLQVLSEEGVRVRDLPLLTGVSKEAISMAMGILRKKSLTVEEPEALGSRVKVACLTSKGRAAQDAYRKLLATLEERWQARFGKRAIGALRKSLERLVGDPAQSPLFRGLEPYPDGWRASVRKPDTLPHYPMVLHRGGFPDGS
jgi:DNA-binding MarR family transcriptional regulator